MDDKIGDIKEIYEKIGLFGKPFLYEVIYEITEHTQTAKMFKDHSKALMFSLLLKINEKLKSY